MQAALLLILFSLIASILGGIFLVGGKSIAEITVMRQESTERFFQSIDKVINGSLTPQNMQAVTSQAVADAGVAAYINNTIELAAQADGRWSTAGVDAWGHVLTGKIDRRMVVLFSGANGTLIQAPVSTFALVSGGPDGVIEPDLQAAIDNANTPGAIIGLDAHNKGNDIVYTFSDLGAQTRIWERLQERISTLEHIVFSEYQLRVQENEATAKFPDIDDELDVARALGVYSIMNEIENDTAGGGRFKLTTTLNAAGDELTITVANDPANPTPWTGSRYIKVLTSEGV